MLDRKDQPSVRAQGVKDLRTQGWEISQIVEDEAGDHEVKGGCRIAPILDAVRNHFAARPRKRATGDADHLLRPFDTNIPRDTVLKQFATKLGIATAQIEDVLPCDTIKQ